MKSATGTRKGSLFYSWFFSYILILFLALAVSLVVYIRAAELVERETDRTARALLSQAVYTLDTVLDNLFRMSLRISENKRIQSIIYYQKPLEDFQYFTFYQMTNDLGLQRYSGLPFSNFYVYLKQLDAVIGPDGFRDSSLHYQTLHQGGSMDFPAWKQILRFYHKRRFIPMQRSDSRGGLIDTLAYLQTIPDQSSLDPPATLVVMIDVATFEDLLSRVEISEAGSSMILDDLGNRIASKGEVSISPELRGRIAAAGNESFQAAIDSTDYFVSVRVSAQADWRYVSLTPRSAFRRNAVALQGFAILGFFACLLLGISAAYIQSLFRYTPLRRLFSIFEGPQRLGTETFPGRGRDELKQLEAQISQALADRNRLGERVKEQEHSLGNLELIRVLKGQSSETLGIDAAAVVAFVGIPRPGARFFPDKSWEERKTLSLLVMANVLESLTRNRVPGRILELDGRAAGLVWGSPKEDILLRLRAILIECADFLSARYDVALTFGLSAPDSGESAVPRLYADALRALEYRFILGTGGLIESGELPQAGGAFRFSTELEQGFINAIRVGDLHQAAELFRTLYAENFGTPALSVEMARCLLADTAAAFVKAMADLDLSDKALPLTRFLSCETAADFRDQALELLEELCAYANSRKKSHNVLLKERMLAYIDANLADPNLCTAVVAGEFDLHPAYCSRFFREQMGLGLGDHIARCRIDSAKRALEQEACPLEELAHRCGFPGSPAFIRAFKKIEGITPGRYRELARKDG
jgi:AraC-like DNA-binding protein